MRVRVRVRVRVSQDDLLLQQPQQPRPERRQLRRQLCARVAVRAAAVALAARLTQSHGVLQPRVHSTGLWPLPNGAVCHMDMDMGLQLR